jgi:hypothetical protein
MEMIEWVEQAGLECLRAHVKSCDDIRQQSNTALAVLTAGAAGALAYGMKALEAPANKPLAIAALAVSVYLFVICAALATRCLMVADYPSVTNTPKNLYQKEFDLNAVREAELHNIQLRIEEAVAINATRSKWLNRAWAAATATPLIFLVTFLVAGPGLLFS